MKELEKAVQRYYNKIVNKMGKNLSPESINFMTKNYAIAYETQRRVDRAAQVVLRSKGVPTIQYVSYLAFAREVWGRARRFSGRSLQNELTLTRNHWQGRGLNLEILKEIEENVLRVLY